uniref:Uncharacterized protein n=1 Tax=Oryza sativa subsp. indica TaxID=39946 RepID=A0A679B8V2_ORYSI|nr:hypothetical protein [Oryza sativa Indica Group]BBD82407.1 hypothetical protein [Oryza sativa Indica Group]
MMQSNFRLKFEDVTLEQAARFTDPAEKLWGNADEVVLFDSIRGSLSPHIDQAKVYYKLKWLKGKYLHAAPGAFAGSHGRCVHDLCTSVWGADLEPLVGDDEGAAAAAADQPRIVPDAATMLHVLHAAS